MAKVTFRLPSKKVQYGYVEIVGEAQELGIGNPADAHSVAAQYVDYMVAFARSEIGAVQAASKEAEPVTEDPATLVREELGGREIASKTNKPWEEKSTPAATPKPWEVGGASASDDDWDI